MSFTRVPRQQLNPVATRPMRTLEDARCFVSVAYRHTHTWPTRVRLITSRAGAIRVGAPRRLMWRPLKPILFKLFRCRAGPNNLSRVSPKIAHNFRRNVFACGNAFCCHCISDCSSDALTPLIGTGLPLSAAVIIITLNDLCVLHALQNATLSHSAELATHTG